MNDPLENSDRSSLKIKSVFWGTLLIVGSTVFTASAQAKPAQDERQEQKQARTEANQRVSLTKEAQELEKARVALIKEAQESEKARVALITQAQAAGKKRAALITVAQQAEKKRSVLIKQAHELN